MNKIDFQRASIVFVLALSVFSDPSIAAKYFGVPPSLYLPIVMLLVLYQIGFLLRRRHYKLSCQVVIAGATLTIYSVLSVAYRLYAGQDFGDISLHIMVICVASFLILLLNDIDFQETLISAIYFAGVLHFATLVQDPLGLRANLIEATVYNLGGGGLGEVYRRETGIFPAPAMLVSFSIILFVVAFSDFSRARGILLPVLGMVVSLAIGLATFNRSFVLGIVFSFAILNLVCKLRRRHLLLYMLGCVALIFVPLQDYLEFVGNRFVILLEGGINESQRWTGNTGVLSGMQIFVEHPFFGSPVAPEGGTLQALGENRQNVNPHNGYVLILATYGLLGSIPILGVYALSYAVSVRTLVRRKYLRMTTRNDSRKELQEIAAMLSLSLIPMLMIEPLSEYGFILLISISPLLMKSVPFKSYLGSKT